MRLLDRIKKWFFKEEQVGIINIGDLIQIPGRDYFRNEKDKLNLIDRYKDEYLSILSQKRFLSSKDLSFDYLQDEMIMNVDLVLEIVGKHNDLYDEIKKSKLDNTIDTIKLKLYLNRIEEMEKDTIARLIALKELEKGRRVPFLNRNALKEEINILTTNLVIFMNQKRAINIEINIHLSNITINDSKIEDVNKRLEELIKISSVYIDINDIINMDIKEEIKIALIERRLEIYCYKNKNEIEKLDEEVRKLDNGDLSFTKLAKKDFLEKINILELKYEVFRRFGRNIVTYEHLYNLYRVKFDIITLVLEDYNLGSYINNEIEKEVYEDIIFRKKEKILKGENLTIKKIFGQNEKRAINVLSSLFKEENNRDELVGKKIRTKYNMFCGEDTLKLLLTFDSDSEHKFKKFYDMPVNSKRSMEYFEDSYFTWKDEIPLSSLMEFMDLKTMKDFYRSKNYMNEYLYHLYYLSKKDSDNYFLPEGLLSIDIPSYAPQYVTSNIKKHHYLSKIQREAKGKNIFFPDSLYNISGDIFDNIDSINFKTKSNLIRISYTFLEPKKQSTIYIPSKLEFVKKPAIDLSNVETIYFDNFDEAALLTKKNEESLCNLLYNVFVGICISNCLYISTTNNQKIAFSSSDFLIDLEEICKDIEIKKRNAHWFIKKYNGIEYYELKQEDIRIIVNKIIDEVEKKRASNVKVKSKNKKK